MANYTLEDLAKDPEFIKIINHIIAKSYGNPKRTLIFQKVREKIKGRTNLIEMVEACSFKLQSMRYHLVQMLQLEGDYAQKHKMLADLFVKKMGGFPGVSALDPIEVRIEFESFIMKTKSLLEIFSQIASSEFKNITSRFIELDKILKQHASKDPRAKLISERINEAKWISDFESIKSHDTMRDVMTHLKTLPVRPQNLVYTKDGVNVVPSGTSHKGKNIKNVDYASSIVLEIESLIEDILKILYDIKV